MDIKRARIDFAIVISIISLVLSLLTLYFSYLQTAKVSVARIKNLGIGTFIAGQNRIIGIPITVINSGAMMAVVEDVRLNLYGPTPKNISTHLMWVGEAEHFPPEPWKTAMQFVVPGKASVARNAIFATEAKNSKLEPGSYTAKLEILSDDVWKEAKTFEVNWEPQFNELTQGQWVSVYVSPNVKQ